MTGQKDKAVHHMQILVDAHPEWKKDRMLSYIISRKYIALNQKDRGLACGSTLSAAKAQK